MPIYLTTGGTVSAVPIVIITLLISFASLTFGVYQYVKKSSKEDIREARTQTTSDVSKITEVMLKLDFIKEDTANIRNEVKGVKQEMGGFRDRLIRVEMKADSAHQRLDDYLDKVGEPVRRPKKVEE